MDFTYVQENGLLGVAAVLAFTLYKVLSNKFPIINGGGHAKRAADAAEAQLKIQIETNTALKEMGVQQKELVDAHTGQFARRDDGTFKWHNNPEREMEIHQTAENTKTLHAMMTRMEAKFTDIVHERGQDTRMDGMEKKLDTFIKAAQK